MHAHDSGRRRGRDGLLRVRTIRLCILALKSMVYSIVVGEGQQPRQPASGDGYDVWHAISASTADVFVTRDERLAKARSQIPTEGFRVVTSLRALLE